MIKTKIKSLTDYEKIIGKRKIEEIYRKATPLTDKHIVHINSTFYGGGVAEILENLVPLMNEVGIATGWRSLVGSRDFFRVTKQIHNALQGDKSVKLSYKEKRIFEQQNTYNASFTHIAEHDAVIIHDPQPLPMITYYKNGRPWIWRCHIDLSNPNKDVLKYLKKFIEIYDFAIFHREEYKIKKLKIPQITLYPSIDPLDSKNIYLKAEEIKKILTKYKIKTNKPIIAQISRFDRWKDPLGVIEIYKKVKRKIDCSLVLLGSFAVDDPEGEELYKKLVAFENEDLDMRVIAQEDNQLVNALQRQATVIIQKSIREGFGLAVTEAMYKATPVVASNVGGIKLQIKNGVNGFLLEPNDIEGFAQKIIKIIKNKKMAQKIGRTAKKNVIDNFIITRHLENYIDILLKVFS